jgi:hypothetical protein
MRATFEGVDRLPLMPTPTPDPRVAKILPVVRAAADAGVKHVVHPDAAEMDGLDFALFTSHARVFAAIEHTGVAATNLRNAIHAALIAGEVAGAMQAGELAAPVDGARVAPVLRTDLAAATATMLGFYAATAPAGPARPRAMSSASPAASPHPRCKAIAAVLEGTAK